MTSANNSCPQPPLRIHDCDQQPTFRNNSSDERRSSINTVEKGLYFSSPLGRHPTVSRRERIAEEGGD
jgi:hypothetical protein